ncbi:hypothetical protein GCM10023196_067640 [Actinoallomurus vinaceus]|uniref:Uncharacterized protein n=1 Tax=Actinoallomurus vinaceus TaxID=1080074 RepID=A0ABP8UMT1_9ACTN
MDRAGGRPLRAGPLSSFSPPCLFGRKAGGGRGARRARQTGGMQKSQPSGAKGFAILVGIMVAIVLVLMLIAVIFSPHHRL